MIEAYLGFPGSGKTYTMTARALAQLERGHRVFSNYPIEGCELFGADDLVDLPPGFIVMDEGHLWMSSRQFHKLPHEWFVKVSQTRKSGWHWLWSAQHPGRMDKAVRDVTQVYHWCHAFPGGYLSDRKPMVMFDNVYPSTCKSAQEGDPHDRELQLARHVRRFQMSVASAYDTMAAIDGAAHLMRPTLVEAPAPPSELDPPKLRLRPKAS